MQAYLPKKNVAKFDTYTADFSSGELWKQGHRLRLAELPFRLLILLIENAGEMVSREELRRRLWPEDLFIDFDNNLNTAIAKIRRVLNDSAGSPRFIETLGRRGYRFIAPVEILSGASTASTLNIQPPEPQDSGEVGWWARQVPLGVMRLDAAGKILYTNPKWTEIVGFSLGQIHQEPWFRIVCAEDSERVRDAWRRSVESDVPFTAEFRVLRPDGAVTWVIMNAGSEREAGRVSGYFATVMDVHAQHLTTLALKESEQRFRVLAEHLPGVVYICKNDENFTKVYVGGPTEALNGYTNAEIMGGVDTFPGLYRKEDADRIKDEVQNAILHRRPYHLTYQFRHRSGEWKWAEEFGAGIYDNNGNLLHIECFVSDITQRKRMEESYRQAQKMEAVGTLTSGLANEFNNVLAAIRKHSEVLLANTSESHTRHEIEEIELATARGAQIVHRLLAFSRKQYVQPTAVNPNSTVREMSEMLRPVIDDNIELIVRLDPKVSNFNFDPTGIQQVILNLATNACEAMPQGGTLEFETACLRLSTNSDSRYSGLASGEYAIIRVRDSGKGMTPDVKERIFEPFFTTKPEGRGTGLGLSTVFGMVHQSGGRVNVDSEPGKGSTFELVFPAVSTSDDSAMRAMAMSEHDAVEQVVPVIASEKK